MSDKKSRKFEEQVAKDFEGGQRQIASGALPFWKQDVSTDNFLIEHKYTEPWTKSFALKKSYFINVEEEAFKLGKLPMFVIEFTGKPGVKLAIIRYDDALALDRYLSKEKYGEQPEGTCKEE